MNDLKIKFTGIPFYIIYGILPITIVYILCLAYSSLNHKDNDFDLLMSFKVNIMIFFGMYLVITLFRLRYIGRSYSIIDNVFIVKSFSRILFKTEIDNIIEIAEYHYKFDSPAFFVHFKTGNKDEYLTASIDCLMYKDSKRLYDILQSRHCSKHE